MTCSSCEPIVWRHCKACNSQRKDLQCWKCGGPTTVPHSSWEYPAMPPVDRIRALAKEVGYAIGEHGSRECDLDLIAAPWTVNAVSADELLEYICKGMVYNGEPAQVRGGEKKPVGRVAYTIQLNGWFKDIDLSICPAIRE